MIERCLLLLLLVHAGATLCMTGLIWMVQVVHYPLMASVGAAQFPAYHAGHSRLITFVVMPLMLVELATAAALLAMRPGAIPVSWLVVGFALAVMVWAATFLLSVPAHSILAGGFNAEAHARLVGTNWIRTVLWTLRGGLSLALIYRAM